MNIDIKQYESELTDHGFTLLQNAFSSEEMATLSKDIQQVLEQSSKEGESIRSRSGQVYAARNLIELYPDVVDLWKREPLVKLVLKRLGSEAGLVRVLFFDKPSEQSWSLPWHKDLTIAVDDNSRSSTLLTKPTIKGGVPHVEASLEILQSMLTLRIHLDAANEKNGALKVISGSHLSGKQAIPYDTNTHLIEADAGDVLAMSPLISHASGEVQEPNLRRRILHLEFCGEPKLPDQFQWYHFYPVTL